MTVVVHRVTKQAARYTPAGGVEKCALCRFFAPQGWCGKVVGPVSARGWCKYYSREMVSSGAGYAGTGGGLPAGATLNLNFMTPGTLNPLLTFTRASTGTYFDSTGTMQTAAINAPRWDYDPVSSQLRGVLLEDQSTNVAFPSVVDNVVWIASNGALTLNATVAPDGTNAATLLVDNVTSVAHTAQLTGTFAYVSGTNYAFSIYAKQATARGLQIYTGSGAFGTAYQNFDLAAGVVGAGTNAAGTTIRSVGNGWYRCTLVATATASASTSTFNVCLTNNNNSAARGTVYSGTGTGVYLWGAQTETGSFPTSQIFTTTAAVTRSIDSSLISSANMAWFTSPGGSWFAEFMFTATAPSNARIIGRPDTAGGVSPLLLTATRTGSQNDGAAVTTANAAATGAVTKGASTWAAGQAKVCLNGGAVASSAALATGYGVFPASGVRFLSVGAALSADNTSGWLRRAGYWPRVLADTEMQQVTT